MIYRCDYCDAELPESYVPTVDGRGRPCEAICETCSAIQSRERAKRLGLPVPDLMDYFEQHLAREIKPRIH